MDLRNPSDTHKDDVIIMMTMITIVTNNNNNMLFLLKTTLWHYAQTPKPEESEIVNNKTILANILE